MLMASYKKLTLKQTYTPIYRIVEILEKEQGEYSVKVQIINKNAVFHMKPEDILKDDNLVDQFSPREIRALTYLGYLGINSPKYTILAKRLSENSDGTIFALKKRGGKKVVSKSAHEIFQDKEVLSSLSATDAHDVGYTVAHESAIKEKRQKEALKQQFLAESRASTINTDKPSLKTQ